MNKILLAILAFIALTMVGYGGMHVYSTLTAKPHTAQANGQIQQATAPEPTKYEVGPPDAQELLELVNAERAKVGVAPLVIDERLNQSAQAKADDMAKNNYFGHVDANGKHGYGYVKDYAPGLCKQASENIVGEDSSSDAVDWWISSPAHYTAMTSTDYALTGFGIRYVDRIPLNKIVSSKPVYSDLIKSYVIVEHFCITR